MSQNPDSLAHLLALIAATLHLGALWAASMQSCARYVIKSSFLQLPLWRPYTRNRWLVAAQLPGLLDQRDQGGGINSERSCLGSPLLGDLVEISFRFRQLGNEVPAQLCQIAAFRVAK